MCPTSASEIIVLLDCQILIITADFSAIFFDKTFASRQKLLDATTLNMASLNKKQCYLMIILCSEPVRNQD